MGQWFYWGDANYTGPYAVGAEYRAAIQRLEAKEELLRAFDKANGTNLLGAHHKEEGRKLRETIRRHKAARRK